MTKFPAALKNITGIGQLWKYNDVRAILIWDITGLMKRIFDCFAVCLQVKGGDVDLTHRNFDPIFHNNLLFKRWKIE